MARGLNIFLSNLLKKNAYTYIRLKACHKAVKANCFLVELFPLCIKRRYNNTEKREQT